MEIDEKKSDHPGQVQCQPGAWIDLQRPAPKRGHARKRDQEQDGERGQDHLRKRHGPSPQQTAPRHGRGHDHPQQASSENGFSLHNSDDQRAQRKLYPTFTRPAALKRRSTSGGSVMEGPWPSRRTPLVGWVEGGNWRAALGAQPAWVWRTWPLSTRQTSDSDP